MNVLITGVTGFAGSHLAEALLAKGGVDLSGTSRHADWPSACAHLAGKVQLHTGDLRNAQAAGALIHSVQPEQIYHVAGYAHVGQSSREPETAWEGNLTATRNLYEAVLSCQGRPRILFVGTGLVYGDANPALQAPSEDAPLRPTSPYASSKAAADLMSYQYSVAPGLDIVRVRPFNHIGPRQSPEFAIAHFAQQIAAIERGAQPARLESGDLRPKRDLTDVRDMVRAYVLLMERGRTGDVYNAGTGTAHAIQELVDRLLALARVKIEVRQQPDLLRAAESQMVCANAAKLRGETGWQPQFTLDQTLADILEYWRHQA